MKISYTVAVAVATLMLGMSSPVFAANQQGGNGSTGNPGTNDPAAVNGGSADMNMMHKSLPRCTSKRTHNCHHASSKHHMSKSM
jgi:hypothetical protein